MQLLVYFIAHNLFLTGVCLMLLGLSVRMYFRIKLGKEVEAYPASNKSAMRRLRSVVYAS